HAVGAEDAAREVAEVHGASLAAAAAGGPPEELGHHPRGLGALGQALPVAAVGGGHEVVGREEGADRRRHRLLPGRQVDEARDLPRREALGHPLLEAADEMHHPVDRQRLLPRGLHRQHPSSRAMTSRWISFVPSPICRILASRKKRETTNSSVYPYPPWICTASTAACIAVSEA